MALYGYARVSHIPQSLDVQIEALRAAGCTVIRSEKKSGTTTEGRVELQTLLDFVRDGDTICVTRVDRIARSIADLQDILRVLKAKGASMESIRRIKEIDNTKPKNERTYRGRPPTIKLEEVHRLKEEGLGATAIAERLGIGRASVYRVLKEIA